MHSVWNRCWNSVFLVYLILVFNEQAEVVGSFQISAASSTTTSHSKNTITLMMLRKSCNRITRYSKLSAINSMIGQRGMCSTTAVKGGSFGCIYRRTAPPYFPSSSKNGGSSTYSWNYNRCRHLCLSLQSQNGIEGNRADANNVEIKLSSIEHEARQLTNQDINLNSPKQIAMALYPATNDIGHTASNQSTSKQILQQLAKANIEHQENTFSFFQKELALLVLEHRALKKIKQQLLISDNRHDNATDKDAKNAIFRISDKCRSNMVAGSTVQSAAFSTLPTTPTPSTNDTTINNNNDNRKTNVFNVSQQPSTVAFIDHVNHLFSPPTPSSTPSKIDLSWHEAIQSITKPSARSLVAQLNPSCPMGYDPTATPFGNDTTRSKTAGKKGSLLGYVREQKLKHPNAVILTRVGEFYETFGIDAVLLVEHCGLNAMANKARAGCPLKNIQATLDGLTSAGFRVAVYEEANDTDAARQGSKGAGSKARIKNRMLAQIVSPASPTYLYDLVLGDSGSTKDALFATPSARPYVGIVHSAVGYAIVEVSTEERNVRVMECVTSEAVACRLASYPPADPLFYVPSMGEEASGVEKKMLPFLPSRWDTDRDGPGSKKHISVLPPSVYMPVPTEGVTDIQRFKQCIVTALLKTIEKGTEDADEDLTHNDFVVLSSDDTGRSEATFTKPLYVETASQLGLMTDPTIPSLVNYLVPNAAPRPTRQFLRRWLLTPPPPSVASSMSVIVGYLKDDSPAVPSFEIPPIGKVLSLIRAGQASAQIFREVMVSIDSTVSIIDMCSNDNVDSKMIHSLMNILRYESGMDASPENLKNRCLDAAQVIEEVVSIYDCFGESSSMDKISNHADDIIPPGFFERNENSWRGRIKPEASMDAYENVEKAALALLQAVAVDFWGASDFDDFDSAKERKTPIVQDIFNNLIGLKAIPSWTIDKDKYYHPRDRFRKLLGNRYTTKKVEDAISSYVEACENATNSVGRVLTDLSETLCNAGHLPAITQAAHVNLILATACQHAAQANHLGWNLATIDESDGPDKAACRFIDLHPYWMDNSVAVLNSFDLNGLFLLTAPNMSGKSTIMRSAAAAALLTNCGFCAPVGPGSFVKRFDSIFVRGASSDVPTENKSAFGAEMGDIAALLRACGDKSLVFVDELGRGTSPEDGSSLAGAVLEAMSSAKMNGFFATHLHSILDLPLRDNAREHIINKQMEIYENENDFRWTYKLVDGICRDSRALKTAARFGIPPEIIQRAEELSSHMKGQIISDNTGLDSAVEPNLVNDCPVKVDTDGVLLSEVNMLVEEVSKENSVIIPPRWSSPPSFEGSSVLYVLQVGQSFYVGETDSLSQRIRQHRSKGGIWAQSSTIAVKVNGGKSNARNLESRIIQKIAQSGFSVLSTTDGRKIKPRTK